MPEQSHQQKICIYYENEQALNFNKREEAATVNIIYKNQNMYKDKKFEKTEHFEISRVKWANNRFKSNHYLNKIKQFCWKSQIKNL